MSKLKANAEVDDYVCQLERDRAELIAALRECHEVLGGSAKDAFQHFSDLSDEELGRLWTAVYTKVGALLAKHEPNKFTE